MGTLVTTKWDNSVATITMDDGKVNALSPDMFAQVNAALDQAADTAAVVLSGRPGVFSAGFDLRVLQARGPEAEGMVRAGFELAVRLLTFPAPVLIACTGHAIAMGSFLLVSADYRIGADGPYKITANEVSIGMTIPGAAIEACRQRLTPAYLSRALTLAEVFPPAAAAAAGFLDLVVPEADLAEAAAAAAGRLAALDRAAHAATKLRVRGPVVAAMRADLEATGAGVRF
ncbi:MAG TPA: crotonase/enoyl-CoA hydratase family protein [Streptosporangiaceae bacterium]|nr:crotonase/enoyl-CoA hydratase family protein [Streptosporangiaceae bacterium]